jgi:hypothetical protein
MELPAFLADMINERPEFVNTAAELAAAGAPPTEAAETQGLEAYLRVFGRFWEARRHHAPPPPPPAPPPPPPAASDAPQPNPQLMGNSWAKPYTTSDPDATKPDGSLVDERLRELADICEWARMWDA